MDMTDDNVDYMIGDMVEDTAEDMIALNRRAQRHLKIN